MEDYFHSSHLSKSMARKSGMPVRRFSAPFPAFERDEAFKQLRSLIRGSRPPIVLIGAGASAKSGYPLWKDLLDNLKTAAKKRNKAADKKVVGDDLNDAPWTAEVFVRDLGRGGLGRFIRKEFGRRRLLTEPHLSLAEMPFPHFLTTNFDCCIERALKVAGRRYKVVSWHQDEGVSDFLINLGHKNNIPRVVYLHGRYNDAEKNIILTESAYVSRYIASDDARRKLMAIFMTHPIVFVGFSMTDPDLANLMREVTARLRAKPPAHYAIMGYRTRADRESMRARMEEKFGVRPVFFCRASTDPNGDDYSNLVPLLEELAGHKLTSKKQPSAQKVVGKFAPAEFDPEDPHKGRFSGLSCHNGRRGIARWLL
jgi:hypothetical protein